MTSLFISASLRVSVTRMKNKTNLENFQRRVLQQTLTHVEAAFEADPVASDVQFTQDSAVK